MKSRRKRRTWTVDGIVRECAKYSDRAVLQREDEPLYLAAIRRGLHSVLPPVAHRSWTDDELIAECQRYETRRDLRDNNESVYTLVRRRNLKDRAFGHMKRLIRVPGSHKDEAYWRNRNAVRTQYQINRKKTDLQFKLSCALRQRLVRAIKGNYRSGSAVRDLGCTVSELKLYLESKFQSGMTWENYGRRGWHIDHIKPLCSFNLTDPEELKRAVHFTNLQPLWASDNQKKGGSQWS